MAEPQSSCAELTFNGILADTGGYLAEPISAAQLAGRIAPENDPQHLADLKNRRFRDDNTHVGLMWGDSNDLSEAGWGVVWGPGAAQWRDMLKPLLDLRRDQAGKYFKEMKYRPGLTQAEFLKANGAAPGPANPAKIPYYLLIVGGPETVPYRFQYQMDVQYAVGRIHFETPGEYAAYAASVVAAEQGQVKLPRQATFFGVQNPDDKATSLSATQLVTPLVTTLTEKAKDWRIRAVLGEAATKARLGQLLGGAETPALLFTASHGLGFRHDNPLQTRHQGALLCQDWPGPINWRKPITEKENFYFSADDVGADANLAGLIAFHFACYGAGTPQLDEFSQQLFAPPEQIAPQPFIARLPQRLLTGGALAVVGHVERAWGCSFIWGGTAQNEVFEVALRHLMVGSRVGYALERFNERYAELATKLTEALDAVQDGRKPDEYALAGMWTAHNDARSYAIIGDPAVRLPLAAEDGAAPLRPVLHLAETPPHVAPAPEAPFGLKETLADAELDVREVAAKLRRLLTQALDDAEHLDIATYTGDDLAQARQEGIEKTARLRALTRVSLSGDVQVCVPAKTEELDERLWRIHQEAVAQAQAQRAELIKALVTALGSVSSLLI